MKNNVVDYWLHSNMKQTNLIMIGKKKEEEAKIEMQTIELNPDSLKSISTTVGGTECLNFWLIMRTPASSSSKAGTVIA